MTPTTHRYAQCSVYHTAVNEDTSLPIEITLSSIPGVGDHATRAFKIWQVGYVKLKDDNVKQCG